MIFLKAACSHLNNRKTFLSYLSMNFLGGWFIFISYHCRKVLKPIRTCWIRIRKQNLTSPFFPWGWLPNIWGEDNDCRTSLHCLLQPAGQPPRNTKNQALQSIILFFDMLLQNVSNTYGSWTNWIVDTHHLLSTIIIWLCGLCHISSSACSLLYNFFFLLEECVTK